MLEVMREPKTINELTQRLHRNRLAITKDIGLLEKVGLVVSQHQANPGHGIQKVICSVAPKIEIDVYKRQVCEWVRHWFSWMGSG